MNLFFQTSLWSIIGCGAGPNEKIVNLLNVSLDMFTNDIVILLMALRIFCCAVGDFHNSIEKWGFPKFNENVRDCI